MLKFFPSPIRRLAFFSALFGVAGIAASPAASLSVFKGTTGGKYSGYYVVAQPPATPAPASNVRLSGQVFPTFTGSGKSGKFVINGTNASVGFPQTITLRSNGRATISPIFPGASGDFGITVAGKYRFKGKHVTITAPVDSNSIHGTLRMDITFGTYGTALSITTRILLTGGAQPISVTITAS